MVNPIGLGRSYTPNMFANVTERVLPVGTTVTTGALCPQTGVWKSAIHQVVVGIEKGTVMPRYENLNVEWVLTDYSISESN